MTEQLGPAETIINAVINYTDHMTHNRPGFVVPSRGVVGVDWTPATTVAEGSDVAIYSLAKTRVKTRIGVLRGKDIVGPGGAILGQYRDAGIFPEVATWMYQQVANVWAMNNEFAARWASYAYAQDHRDLKVVLAAFMLVQSRFGEPVRGEGGKVEFRDDDFRDVGEAMLLLSDKKTKNPGLDPKMLLRVYEVLKVPGVVEINRKLGFGVSLREPALGRYVKTISKWLRYREQNPKLLEGLVRAGFRRKVMRLAQLSGFKPESSRFFEVLRWKQQQAEDGRRTLAIGVEVAAAENWAELPEAEICRRIVLERPNFKVISGRLAKGALSRAILAASIEANCLSDKDLIILTPTLEEFGLLEVPFIKTRWESATKAATDTRALNIATRVRNENTKETLKAAADTAVQAAVAKVAKDLRIYVVIDISGSMATAIIEAKQLLGRFLQAFPLDQLHISVFNTMGTEVALRSASAAGVEQAFRGIRAGGGTDYGQGIRCLQDHKPQGTEDSLIIFVGDEEQSDTFEPEVIASGLRPSAFGLLRVGNKDIRRCATVRNTAAALKIPCFLLVQETIEDPYALPRTLQNLIASTPVSTTRIQTVQPQRTSLVEMIKKTPLLVKPTWA